jgi:predicted nucleotidyltransferase
MPRRRVGVTGRPAGPLRAPLDYLVGAPSRVAVLRVLAAGGAPMSQRELARRAGVQVRSAQQAVELLLALGVVERIVGGRDHLVSLNRRHELAGRLVALFDAEAELFRGVRERLHGWAQEGGRRRIVSAVVLFGSGARGDDTPASDLDVLVVTAGSPARSRVEEAFAEVAADLRLRFGVDARALVLGRGEARRRWRRREAPLPDVVADGVAVVGPAPRELVGG